MRPHVWCEFRSLLWFCARVHGALESKSHQQLDRCMAATVWAARHHSNSPMHHSLSPLAAWKPHSAPAPGHTDWKWNAGTCLSETSEVWPWAKMTSDWNMVSNQQSFIAHSIDQWQDCFIACLETKNKHSEHLLWCVSLWYVTVMTFKAILLLLWTNWLTFRFTRKGARPMSWQDVCPSVCLSVRPSVTRRYSI